MKRFWRRGLSLFLALVLTLGLLPTSALAGLVDNSRSQNEYILEQLEALWGDEATAEEALALLKRYGLVDGDGNVITDWSGELYLEEAPRPLTLAEAAAARSGAVTVNGHAAQAREVAEALSQLEEPAGPAVTVLGTQVSDPDALEDLIDRLDQWGVLTETGVLTDWDLTVPGERRQVTAEELTAMAEAGEADDDTLVLVGETPISLGDLRLLLDIEAELRRIEETYFQEEVELSPEQAENLVSIYEQLLADGGFTLYNVNAADDLDFPSGIDRNARVTLTTEGFDALTSDGGNFKIKWEASGDSEDISFQLRLLDGSGKGLSFQEQPDSSVITCEGNSGSQTVSLEGWDDSWENDELWNGQHLVFVQAYDLKGALFSNDEDTITIPLALKNEKDFTNALPIQWSVTNQDGQTFQYSSVQKYLLRNDVVNTGTWKYTTSGYKGDTCFVQGGSVGVKDSLWISASISGGLAYIDPMQAYYYQYLKATASVGDTLLFGKEVGYPGNVASEVGYGNHLFAAGILQTGENPSEQYAYYNADKPSAVKAIENSTPQTDSVKSTSGSINERGIEQLAEAESVTLSAVGWWTAVGSGRANPYYDGWSYGLRCSNQTNASVTMTVALNDTTAPTVTEISYPDVTDDLFPAGAQVPVTVTFSELVQSDGATITANGTVLSAQEAAGTLSKTLTFLYPVEAVDNRTIQVTEVSGVKDMAGNSLTPIDKFYQSENILDQTPMLRDAVANMTVTATPGKLQPVDDNPEETTAQVTVELMLPVGDESGEDDETKFRELLMANTFDGADYISSVLEGVILVDGKERVIPLLLDDGTNPTKLTATFALNVLDLLEDRSFVMELRGKETGEWIYEPYAPFSIDPPTPLTADDIQVSTHESWPTENVFVNAPPEEGLQLYAEVTGTGDYTWTQLRWYSDDEDVARIDPTTGEVTLYGTGTASFYIRAVNGNLSAYRAGTEDAPYVDDGIYSKKVATLTVGEGDAPYLRIPEDELTVRSGDDVTLRWAGNLVQKNMQYSGDKAATTFTIQVFEGGLGEDGQPAGELLNTVKFTYDPSDPDAAFPGTDLPMWSGEGESLTPIQSYTLTGLDQVSTGGQPSYTLKLTASTIDAVPGGAQTFTGCATVTVVSRPVTVTLERPESFYLVNQGTLDLSYVLTDYDMGNNAQFKLTVTDNNSGLPVVETTTPGSSQGGSFSINLADAETDGFRAIYDVSIQAKNTAEPDWSRDSFTLYIYDQSCLDLVVQERENGRVVVDGDHVSMSNEEWIASLDQDQILALNREIDLQTAISINQDRAWGEASDRMEWSSQDSSVAAVNYQQGTYYENIENLTYSSYAPATEFLLSGRDDGTTVVEAVHALVGDDLSSSVTVDVNTLKDKLYLFQFFPASQAELTYTNGAGVRKEGVLTAADGRAAVYEPTGIASDVYVKATINNEVYLGTVYQEDLVSQEKDAVTLELYPLNSLTLRKAASLPLYLKGPDGQPYSGEVTVRVGVYRNGVYCAEALYDAQTGANSKDDTEDDPVITPEVVTTRGDEDHVVTFDEKKGAAPSTST